MPLEELSGRIVSVVPYGRRRLVTVLTQSGSVLRLLAGWRQGEIAQHTEGRVETMLVTRHGSQGRLLGFPEIETKR
jgi:hypothetical protein